MTTPAPRLACADAIVLVSTPGAGLVTLTRTWQLPLAAMVPLLLIPILFTPAVPPVSVPPQLLNTLGELDTTMPAGKVSVKPTTVAVTLAGLLTVIVRMEVPPAPIGFGLNNFVIDGRPIESVAFPLVDDPALVVVTPKPPFV